MRRRPTSVRLLALGLLPALVLAGAVPAWSLFFCSMRGEAMSSSCCDDAVESDTSEQAGPVIASAECCRKIGGDLERPAYVPLAALVLALPPVLVADVAVVAPVQTTVTPDAQGPDATGPPIRLRTSIFLI